MKYVRKKTTTKRTLKTSLTTRTILFLQVDWYVIPDELNINIDRLTTYLRRHFLHCCIYHLTRSLLRQVPSKQM